MDDKQHIQRTEVDGASQQCKTTKYVRKAYIFVIMTLHRDDVSGSVYYGGTFLRYNDAVLKDFMEQEQISFQTRVEFTGQMTKNR